VRLCEGGSGMEGERDKAGHMAWWRSAGLVVAASATTGDGDDREQAE
jgi:hypothetical protein